MNESAERVRDSDRVPPLINPSGRFNPLTEIRDEGEPLKLITTKVHWHAERILLREHVRCSAHN